MSVKNKAIAVEATTRTEFGKGAARRARRAGLVPVVVYGHGMDPLHLTVNRLDFTSVVRNNGVNAIVELNIDGDKQLAMIKHLDQNVLTFNIDHIDLQAIKRGEKVEVEVPITTEGEVAPGAMFIQDADVLLLEADVLSIPEEIVVSIEGMEIGSQILAGDIEMPEDCTLVADPETLVVNVLEPEEEELPEPGEEGEEGSAEASEESGDEESGDSEE